MALFDKLQAFKEDIQHFTWGTTSEVCMQFFLTQNSHPYSHSVRKVKEEMTQNKFNKMTTHSTNMFVRGCMCIMQRQPFGLLSTAIQ